ncbi:FAD-dependent oxidoreductase [Phycisphaerales bacterium AB-hyl4]|uniref:FAD-dependent oxidoreductase n=1 Tax=Natronomicrosphaera hydrolytica TaxID=3242702 RepID=A0ABV4U5H8_9BACT
MPTQTWQSCFDHVHDVAILGAGYAGFAAARALHAAGRRVLLIDRGGDLLWESGRALMSEAGREEHPLWHALVDEVRRRGSADDDYLDGAIAEIVASSQLADDALPVLYYAGVVGVQMADDLLVGITVATKAGRRRIAARQWIDATEHGELLALLPDPPAFRRPSRQLLHVFLQHHSWPADLPASIEAPLALSNALAGVKLTWRRSFWETERLFCIDLPGDSNAPRTAIHPALQALYQAMPAAVMKEAVVSHVSAVALPTYERSADAAIVNPALPGNVTPASPAMTAEPVFTLAERFRLGARAASALADPSTASASSDLPVEGALPVGSMHKLTADVVVVGGGTGGAVAAIAAGRAGARVICLDALPFPGGIGAGGAIHLYYFGVPGGMQAELDQRVRETMAVFGRTQQVHGFHPDAKKTALEQMMREAGVTFLPQTMAFDVERSGQRVQAILASRPEGPCRIEADGWIDGTGDGDLCALAGAHFKLGREGDGLLHAYSQSAGCLKAQDKQKQQRVLLRYTNYDAGWVDPTDPDDLSRARVVGVCQYLRDSYGNWTRPTYIAPAIGLRQGRQIETRYMLTMADLIERRQFADVIGFTGAHYDNHSIDFEFESDEGLFWVWLCRQWRTRLACEMPYGMIVPRDLDNVWIASRALGVTMDAHSTCRMQRDMQRVGEAAGHAAALAVAHRLPARDLPISELQSRLAETGAIDVKRANTNVFDDLVVEAEALASPIDDEQIEQGLDHLARGVAHASLWYLYRSPERARSAVLEHLQSDNPHVSWLSAGIAAMWGDATAEPRLIRAITTREYGYDDFTDRHLTNLKPGVEQSARPEHHHRLVPNWLTAVSMLRACGTSACVPALLDLAGQPDLMLNVRTAIGLTFERLVQSGRVVDTEAVKQVIERLLREPVPGSFVVPGRCIGQMLNKADEAEAEPTASPRRRPEAVLTPYESHLWQLHLVIARLARLADLPLPVQVVACFDDPRAAVRRSFEPIRASRSLQTASD